MFWSAFTCLVVCFLGGFFFVLFFFLRAGGVAFTFS